MAEGYSAETVGVLDGAKPVPDQSPGNVTNARIKRIRATFDLSLASVAKAIGDTNVIGNMPRGGVFSHYHVNGVALGAVATLAIGSRAASGKYRTAAIKNTAGLEIGGNVAAVAAASLDIDELIIMTIAAAALPGAGLLTIDIFYTSRS